MTALPRPLRRTSPWLRWFPWRYLVRRLAQQRGLIDPLTILARFERFAQPLQIREPLELLRAGLVLHARGLMNASAIQHNLDWVWPYWVEHQYDPRSAAFVPRAFSITHVNLTHRNWTAVGLPDVDALPIVDPRGLLTPLWDGWSLDAWVIGADGEQLLPSRAAAAEQSLELGGGEDGAGVRVVTRSRSSSGRLELCARAELVWHGEVPCCELAAHARSASGGALVIALRPCNPEGVSFIDAVERAEDGAGWNVGGQPIRFSAPPLRSAFSDYREGDVYHRLGRPDARRAVRCDVGLATAASEFALQAGAARELRVCVPLAHAPREPARGGAAARTSWSAELAGSARLRVPDARIEALYAAALRTLVLHAPGLVYPGPYTYKRFWFRDAAFILHALLCAGLERRVERALERFPQAQTLSGFFHSQEGEWDSNGQVLWIFERFARLSGHSPDAARLEAVRRAAQWICRTRLSDALDAPHAGLMPAGLSAEHLGPNDFYYWDDFWSVQGLRSAARLLEAAGERERAARLEREAEQLLAAVERSLAGVAGRLGRPALPASPYRRLDGGAVGSLAAGYPLQLWPPDDPRLLDTAHYLLQTRFLDGALFHDIVHSGINAYLTLHVAQVLLRAGDPRCHALLERVAELASPTGQWPEAIHPRTGGGCMGDGQHAWAAAEWVLYLRSAFVREEGPRLVLGSGLPPHWLAEGAALGFGPTPTPFGPLELEIEVRGGRAQARWRASWRGGAPELELRLAGFGAARAAPGASECSLARTSEPHGAIPPFSTDGGDR